MHGLTNPKCTITIFFMQNAPRWSWSSQYVKSQTGT